MAPAAPSVDLALPSAPPPGEHPASDAGPDVTGTVGTGSAAALPPEPAPAPPPAPAAPRTAAPPAAAITSDEVAALLRRAADLLTRGDMSGARLVLGRAASAGSAQAKFGLAQTYDPWFLALMKVRGIRPDPQKARELYAEALSGGIDEARIRLDRLAAR